MRISIHIALIAAIGCSSKGSTTVGDCPEGYAPDANGTCVEDDGSEEPPDPNTDDTGEPDDSCTVDLYDTEPGDGDTEVYWQDDLLFWLDGPDDTASVEVVDADGHAIEGALLNEEGALTWSPNSGLIPDSAHTATVTWCGGEESFDFTTSSLGAPLEADVAGSTYSVDLGTATWVKPAGLELFIGDALDVQLLVGVEEASDVLDFVGAIPMSGTLEQDPCVPTLDFEPIDFSTSPYFEVGPVDLPFSFMDISVTLWGMNLSGTFHPDGTGMSKLQLAASIDVRDIGPALGDVGLPIDLSDPDTACDTLTLLGVSCESCPSDDTEYCIGLDLRDIEAEIIDSVVTPVDGDALPAECE